MILLESANDATNFRSKNLINAQSALVYIVMNVISKSLKTVQSATTGIAVKSLCIRLSVYPASKPNNLTQMNLIQSFKSVNRDTLKNKKRKSLK